MERTLETLLYASRWILAPIYLARISHQAARNTDKALTRLMNLL